MFARRRWHLETSDGTRTDGGNGGRRKRGGGKRMESGDLQLLFPETSVLENAKAKSVRSIKCTLNLERKGKFILSIAGEDDECNTAKKEHDPILQYDSSVTSTTPSSGSNINHQPLKGEWFLTPNPYCVTDRQYDTLLLVSEPRMRRIVRKSSVITEKATVELRCKIWGRYGLGAVRKKIGIAHGRVAGRMTHGTVIIVKERRLMDDFDDDGKNRVVPTREVIGTFSGRTISQFLDRQKPLPGTHIGLGDEEEDDELDFGDNFDELGVLQTQSR